MEGEPIEAEEFLQVGIDREVDPVLVDRTLFRAPGRVPEDLSDIGDRKFDALLLKRIGQKVVSCTVLSHVSGSAGFRSSVFLSSCAAACAHRSRSEARTIRGRI